MTAHGEVVRSYEPEEMEPTKKQRFCALVHGSARLDDHAIIGDVTHERTVQRRVHGLGRARNVDGYIHHPGWQRFLLSQRPKGHLRCISRPLGEREVRHGGLRPTRASS